MADDYIEKFFESVYNHELEQKRHLDSADGLLITVIGALIGVGAYFLSLAPASSWCFSCAVFWLLTITFFVPLVGGLYCCAASMGALWAQYMSYIASPKEWGSYVDGLTKYHADYQKGLEIDNRVRIDLAPIRRQHYIKAGEFNRTLIISKHGHQVWAKKCIAAAIFLMLLNAIPATIMQVRKDAKAGNSMSNETRPTAGPAKPSEPQPPPQKPQPPEIVVIREGDTSAKR